MSVQQGAGQKEKDGETISGKRFETDFAGKKLVIEVDRFHTQADICVTARLGDTVVMATVDMSEEVEEGIDFFPLMVDLEERYAASGSIKGPKFQKREGKPTLDSVLIARMIDRGLRPLFPQDMRNEVQVILLPLSIDMETPLDIVALLAAATAVHASSIPFDGPVAGVRVGLIDGQFVANPTFEEMKQSDLNLVVMGDSERITMVDCGANDVPDDTMLQAFDFAMRTMGPIAEFIDHIRNEAGREKRPDEELHWGNRFSEEEQKIIDMMKEKIRSLLWERFITGTRKTKKERKEILKGIKQQVIDEFSGEYDEETLKKLIDAFFYDFVKSEVTRAIIEKDLRVDGRKLDEIRPLSAEVGVLPRTHGTGLFTRGETQVLSTVTLGAPGDELFVEGMESDRTERYFHHYNFLPFCVGEVRPLRGTGRRELGHGALAEKALRPVIPPEDEFPYTIRVVSEVMSSNGSSSMASTCGSTLALMDAGVPIKKPVAGIAMGLAQMDGKWKVLTDLQDLEDGPGGMDFKFTGTRDGITAIQMDTKSRGLSMEIIEATFRQMRPALNRILDLIQETIPEPRKELSPYAPRIIKMKIDPEKIGDVIGPGGKVVRSITDELGVSVDIYDNGEVVITSKDVSAAEEARKRINDLVREIKVGEVFNEAEVVNIMPYGAFVRLLPGRDALLHISEMGWERISRPEDKVRIGDKVRVKVIGVKDGRIEVSMKALIPPGRGQGPYRPRDTRQTRGMRRDQRGHPRDGAHRQKRDNRNQGRRNNRDREE